MLGKASEGIRNQASEKIADMNSVKKPRQRHRTVRSVKKSRKNANLKGKTCRRKNHLHENQKSPQKTMRKRRKRLGC
jgi:hypothetical protein